MTALQRDLYVEQGATFVLGFTWHQQGPPDSAGDPTVGAAYDLTGASARMQIRKTVTSPVLVEATTENGRITLGGATGRVDVVLTDADTDLLTGKRGVYDLEVEMGPAGSDAQVRRLMQGAVVISPNVTRDAP